MKNKETLEEFAKQEAIKQYSEDTFGNLIVRKSIEKGAKWKQERMYSEEEVENILIEYVKTNPTKPYRVVNWFRQIKKK